MPSRSPARSAGRAPRVTWTPAPPRGAAAPWPVPYLPPSQLLGAPLSRVLSRPPEGVAPARVPQTGTLVIRMSVLLSPQLRAELDRAQRGDLDRALADAHRQIARDVQKTAVRLLDQGLRERYPERAKTRAARRRAGLGGLRTALADPAQIRPAPGGYAHGFAFGVPAVFARHGAGRYWAVFERGGGLSPGTVVLGFGLDAAGLPTLAPAFAGDPDRDLRIRMTGHIARRGGSWDRARRWSTAQARRVRAAHGASRTKTAALRRDAVAARRAVAGTTGRAREGAQFAAKAAAEAYGFGRRTTASWRRLSRSAERTRASLVPRRTGAPFPGWRARPGSVMARIGPWPLDEETRLKRGAPRYWKFVIRHRIAALFYLRGAQRWLRRVDLTPYYRKALRAHGMPRLARALIPASGGSTVGVTMTRDPALA